MKRTAFAAFTAAGAELARHIAVELVLDSERTDEDIVLAAAPRVADKLGIDAIDDLASWTAGQFEACDALVFVGATGIAVRAIAPCLADKLTDPAVVCVDERGAHVIPLVSGHVGGANELARHIARITGGTACVSTATDVNGRFAVDEWAARQGMTLVERTLAKEVSATLLAGGTVGFSSEFGYGGALPNGISEDASCELGIHVGLDTASCPFERTLHLVPRIVTAGVGCRKGLDAGVLEQHVREVLESSGVAAEGVERVCSIDVKAGEPAIVALAAAFDVPCTVYSADELAQVEGMFSSSEFVEKTVGVDNVCERAACAAGATLLVRKQAGDGCTVALAVRAFVPSFADDGGNRGGALHIVGLGPGAGEGVSLAARRALESCDAIAGYTVYTDLVKSQFPGKEIVTTPMRREVERCKIALERAAAGADVCMVCSGDPGVYGMASLIFELAHDEGYEVPIEVIPGVSAANGGAAVLGAPLTHDFAVISLSDLLTPWEKIEARLAAAAQADFVVCLYNPSSRKRADYLEKACKILLGGKSADTVCGYVRNIGREGEEMYLTTLGELTSTSVDMFTTVFVGNAQTKVIDGHMVTPRGYLQREERA